MGLLDLVAIPSQRVAYLFPEVVRSATVRRKNTVGALDDVFVFQFWPQQVQDSYQVNYATKQIPGASHPLYQWTGGGGRTISFEASFVSEIQEDELSSSPFTQRVQAASLGLGASAAQNLIASILPSSRYTVNVVAALASLQRYLYGRYNDINGKKGVTEPPQKLILVLPNTNLGRRSGNDGILCILLRADITMESWFPNGQVRSATANLQFAEIIQHSSGEGSNIKYIGADAYDDVAKRYLVSGTDFSNATI